MLKTGLLFVLANLASLLMLGPVLGFVGPIGGLWIVGVLKTAPELYLPLLFVWLPVWLWVVAIRRAWSASDEIEREENVTSSLVR